MVKSREMFIESPREMKLRSANVGEGASGLCTLLTGVKVFKRKKTGRTDKP